MEAVIFVGVQASGKTSFYRERFFETHVRISLDMLRTRGRERILLEACLRAQQPFVIDNTNPLAADRSGYIALAKAARFRVVGYYFRTELRDAIGRNAHRTDKKAIPVPGLIGAFKRLEPPTPAEGFDELYTATLLKSGGFTVAPLG